MRRSNKMAWGLCSSAKARPSCGTPVSITSKRSLNSRRIRRRMASSSSTTSSLSIAKYLLSARLNVGSNQFGQRVWGKRRGLPSINDFADFADEDLFDEGFVEEVNSGIENSMTGDEAVGIAGHIENLHARLAQQQVFGQDAAVYARHDDIGQQEIKNTSKARGDLKSVFAAFGRKYAESSRFKKSFGQFSQWLGVFHEKNGFGAAQIVVGIGFKVFDDRLTSVPREVNLEGRAFANDTFQADVAVALFDDAVNGGESKPRALA